MICKLKYLVLTVVMESFSEVVYLLRMPDFLLDQGSKESSRPSGAALEPESVCHRTGQKESSKKGR